jgi:nucleotide-binding universal stress UspA family protein
MNRVLFQRVVCAVDLSDQSAPVLRRALALVQLHGGELFVVHVTHERLESTESAKRSVTGAFFAMRRLADAEPYHTVPVRWIMAYGSPAIELARFIRRTNADLAVVGGALPRLSTGVVGTVAHAILRTTGCPVLVVPRTLADEASPTPYREILCGVSSGLSTSTLRYALSFAQEYESRLTILNVEQRNEANAAEDGGITSDVDGLRAAIPDHARAWSVIDQRLESGEPAEELVKAARELATDLVIVGSTAAPNSDGGLGSVALGALTLTKADVLIVPAAGVVRENEALPWI